MLRKVGTICAAILVASLAFGGEARAQGKELKFAGFIPTNAVTYADAIKQWIEDVNAKLAAAGGKYHVKPYFGSVMGRDPSQYSKLVKSGVADIAFVTFGQSAELFPDTTVFELPFLTETALEASLAHWRLHKRMEMRGYDGYHWISLVNLRPYNFHFNTSFASLDDLKGRKVRSGGRIQSQILAALGMTPVSGSVTASAESLSRGTWDGIFLDWSAASVFGVPKVAKFHYDLEIASVALGIAANKEVFDGMDAESRGIIDSFSGEVLTTTIGKLWDRDNLKIKNEIAADKDAAIVKPTPAETARARKAMETIVSDWKNADPRGGEVLQKVTDIIKEIRASK